MQVMGRARAAAYSAMPRSSARCAVRALIEACAASIFEAISIAYEATEAAVESDGAPPVPAARAMAKALPLRFCLHLPKLRI